LTSLVSGRIGRFAREHRLPTVAAWREFVDGGCLLSYGPDRAVQARRIAEYVVKGLDGAKPRDLPVERPAKFELVVNLKTAKAIGLELPFALVNRADEVIE